MQANGQLTRASLYRPLIVAYRNGSPVRLDELGNVIDSVQNDKISNYYNDEHAVILAIQRQPGTNTVEVVEGVRKILPQFQAILPPSIQMTEIYDRSALIQESVNDVKFTLFLAICLVVLVIFLFLRNLSATVIPSIALPMSIVGTFAVMYLLDYTVDNLSLMALTLSVGFVVDDAIVMLENIVRHMEMGEDAMEAALKGSKEIGFTIVSMTLVACGRVHSGAFHGRDHRAAAARILGGHHDGRAGFRIRFADADADACAAASFSPSTTKNTAASICRWSDSSSAC